MILTNGKDELTSKISHLSSSGRSINIDRWVEDNNNQMVSDSSLWHVEGEYRGFQWKIKLDTKIYVIVEAVDCSKIVAQAG